LQGTGALAATCVIGCTGTVVDNSSGDTRTGDPHAGGDSAFGDTASGDPTTPGDGPVGDPTAGDPTAGDPTAGDDAQPGDGANRAPVWQTIPDQTWVVGVPVMLDLANYCSDPDGDTLAFSLDQTLPAGVTLTGSVISGTPTAETAAAPFVATADDGH
jgi:hypothetical protein